MCTHDALSLLALLFAGGLHAQQALFYGVARSSSRP